MQNRTQSLNPCFLFCETSFRFKIPRILLGILFWIVFFHRLMLVLSHSVASDSLWPYGLQPGSSVHGVFPARILEWVAISSSKESPRPRDQTQASHVSPALAGGFFAVEPPGKSLSYMDIYYSELNLEEDLNIIYSQYQWHLLPFQIIYWLAISSQQIINFKEYFIFSKTK